MNKPRTKMQQNIYGKWYMRQINDSEGNVAETQYKLNKLNGVVVAEYTNSYERGHYVGWCRHRKSGPALYNRNGIQWYVMGVRILSTQEYCELCKFSKMKTLQWALKYGEWLPTEEYQL